MEDENTGSRAKVQAKKPPRERKKRSRVWPHYEVSRNGDGKKIANCKKCHNEFVAESTDGTTHLQRHLKTCRQRKDGAALPIAVPPTIPAAPPIVIAAPPESLNCDNPADSEEATADLAIPAVPAQPPIDEARPESSNCSKQPADWEEATADLARMIALHGYDPSIVEDSYFKSFVRRLNPDFQLPSRAAIEDICDGVQDDAERVLQSALDRNSKMVNVAIDRTETALGPVLYVAHHFIDDDWNRRSTVEHLNMDLAEDMETMPLYVNGYNLSDKDDVKLLRHGMPYEAIPSTVFSMRTGAVGDLVDYLEDTEQRIYYDTTHYDVLQTVASCFCNIINSDTWSDSVTRQEREQLYSRNGLNHLLPYDKWWYERYCSVLFHLQSDPSFSLLAYKMCDVLGEIYRAIKTISDPNHPTSNIVLLELFKVRETLHSEIAKVSGHEADLYDDTYVSKNDFVDALVKAEGILVRSIKEIYLEWSIPLVLDPRYKLKYISFVFTRAFNSDAKEYISKITGKIVHIFSEFSENVSETDIKLLLLRLGGDVSETDDEDDDTEMSSAASAHQLDQAWGEHRRSSEATKTELDRYLEGPLVDETDDFDILNWWKLNSSLYPTLAKIARAALAMPTCRKPSSELMSQITSRIRGYSKGKLRYCEV